MHLETQIFDDNDNLIQINGYFIKGQRGIRDSFGQQLTEDDHDEVEIESAFLGDEEIELTDEQIAWATEALWDEVKKY